MNPENRLIDIETKIVYQDRLLEDLNQVIYQQQLKMDELEKKVSELLKKMGDDINPAHLAPPHY